LHSKLEALILHPHDAAQALPLEHQVERRVDLGEGHAVCDELLQLQLLHRRLIIDESGGICLKIQVFLFTSLQLKAVADPAIPWSLYYLLHVHLDDVGQVGAGLVVSEEGPLESLLVEEVHGVGLELVLPVRDTHQHGHTPSLHSQLQFPIQSAARFRIPFSLKANGDRTTEESLDWLRRTYVVDTFEGRYHGVDVAGALHAAVHTAVGQLNEYLQQQ